MSIRDYEGLKSGVTSKLPGDFVMTEDEQRIFACDVCRRIDCLRASDRRKRCSNTSVERTTDAEIKRAAQFQPGSVVPVAEGQRKTDLRARGRVRKRAGEMNRTEAAFVEELKRMQTVGEIVWWRWDCLTLRLADRTHYHPDFAVLYADGLLRLIDTKGCTTKDGKYRPFCEEDAVMKMKVCAEQFPIVFSIAYQLPKKAGGGWRIEDV